MYEQIQRKHYSRPCKKPYCFRKINALSYRFNLPALSIIGINLVHSSTTKFLGILVDNKLNFAPHLRDVCTKVSRGIEVCKKLTLMMPFTVMRKQYFTLIYHL